MTNNMNENTININKWMNDPQCPICSEEYNKKIKMSKINQSDYRHLFECENGHRITIISDLEGQKEMWTIYKFDITILK